MSRIFLLVAWCFISLWSCKTGDQTSVTLTESVDSLMTAAYQDGFHGEILVVEHDRVVLEKGYGLANTAAGLAFSPEVLVQIGSNVKDFTKTAIYQMVERGQLDLDDTLGAFISELHAPHSGITILQLLEHRSGLPIGLTLDEYPLTAHEMVSRLQKTTLVHTPGTVENYSNLGYSLLAFIIGQVSNLDYDQYIAQHILFPLKLIHTGSYLPGHDTTLIAHGYRQAVDKGTILDLPHDGLGHLWSLKGNGGYLSTLREMHTFYTALKDTFLVKQETFRKQIFPWDQMTVLAGSDMVSTFIFAHFPLRGVDIFLSSNHAEYPANKLLPAIEGLLGINGVRKITDQDTAVMSQDWPPGEAGQLVSEYISAFNSGDTTLMRQFFQRHADQSPDAPSITERLQRYVQMRDNLGTLTYLGFRRDPSEPAWQIKANTAQGDLALLTFLTTPQQPPRLLGIKVMVGD